MEYLPTKSQHKNVLPPSAKNWLAFYDDLAEDLRKEPKTVTQIVGTRGDLDFYEIEREFLLARIGEELLPSRLAKKEVNALEQAMHLAGRYDA